MTKYCWHGSSFFSTFVEDPLQDYMDGEGTDSVSSLIIASFSTRQISTNMYCGGDLEVLLDVISRRLADYGHGDQVIFIVVRNKQKLFIFVNFLTSV